MDNNKLKTSKILLVNSSQHDSGAQFEYVANYWAKQGTRYCSNNVSAGIDTVIIEKDEKNLERAKSSNSEITMRHEIERWAMTEK
ncbi:MAG: hypothetical protein H6611_03085 [Ignavibacteriales bacterium]|nr:hypothetical protein [Ignavibacteriales bacterium]